MNPEEEAAYYKKAYEREKRARKEAERILEVRARELFDAHKKLVNLNANLENTVVERGERIRAAEQNFKNLVESVGDIIYQTDIDGLFTYVNNITVQVLGHPMNELLGKNFTDFIHPDFVEKASLFYRDQLLNKTEITYLEFKVFDSDNNERWIGQNVRLVFTDGFPVGFMAVARDITERVKNDNILKKNEEKYRKMFEGAFDGVVRLNTNGQFVEWNSNMEEMLGYSGEELRLLHIKDIVHPDDLEHSASYFKKLQEDGFYTNYVGRLIGKKGNIINVEVNSIATYEDGVLTGSIDNVRDISERASIEKAIIRNEEKYRNILENMELGLLEVDANGLVSKVYPSFCQLTGYAREDLLGVNPDELLLHPDSVKKMNEENQKRETGEMGVYEVQIRQKSGDFKWVMISGAPFYNQKGEYSGSIGVHLDITNQKKLEIDLKKANELAQASAKAKELFLANMSHEIRTPLNAVIGLSNLLCKMQLSPDQKLFVSDINNSANNLLLLVNDILDITKIESGKLELSKINFNLHQTIRKILSSANYLSREKSLLLEVDLDDDLDRNYFGDELKISQILMNLIGNAIKFTDEGCVTLRLKKKAEKENKHAILFEVTDTGKGIAPDALNSIFKDFTQEDSSIAREYGGTGLGLSISHKLVDLLGGQLEVSSEINVGTRFFFTLWLEMSQAKEDEDVINFDAIDWSQIRILTAEDNPVNQLVIEATIESWGGHTEIVENGQEAIETFEESSFDLILMDLQMPIMDGVTATKHLRNVTKTEVPIIAFTANAIKSEIERCYEAGINDYVLKPFNEDDLKRKILLSLDQSELTYTQNDRTTEEESDFSTSKLSDLAKGDENFITRMLTIFETEAVKQLEKINATDDSETISRIAHRLKPSIDYLSSDAIKTLVRQIENKAFEEKPELLTAFKNALQRLIESTRKALKK